MLHMIVSGTACRTGGSLGDGNDGIIIERNVVFGTGDGNPLSCDIYRRADLRGAPAVLLLRSRGAMAVPPTDLMALELARHAVVAIVPEFRVGFRHTGVGFEPYPPEVWPAGIHDVKAAVRWTRATSTDLGVDAASIFLLGYSNAGIMALVTAATAGRNHLEGRGGHAQCSSDVTGAIAFSTPTRLSAWGIPLIVGAQAAQDLIDEASAITHAGPQFPPVLLFHSSDDPMIPSANSTSMYEALRSHGVPCELHLFAGYDHGMYANEGLRPHFASLIRLFVERYRPQPT